MRMFVFVLYNIVTFARNFKNQGEKSFNGSSRSSKADRDGINRQPDQHYPQEVLEEQPHPRHKERHQQTPTLENEAKDGEDYEHENYPDDGH